jgi:hypothetical protein
MNNTLVCVTEYRRAELVNKCITSIQLTVFSYFVDCSDISDSTIKYCLQLGLSKHEFSFNK